MHFFSPFLLVLQRMQEESLGRNTTEDELLTRIKFRVPVVMRIRVTFSLFVMQFHTFLELSKARFRRRTSHEPNRIH